MDEMTPLLTAAYNGDFEMVRVLLEYKADVNARHNGGWTSLHLASRGNLSLGPNITPSFSNVARLLLEHGADINAKATTHFDGTPLHLAAEQGRVEIVHVLLQNGADVSMKDDRGRTALQVASDRGHAEVVKLLSEHRAR
jgi:ankyrin repeat protein